MPVSVVRLERSIRGRRGLATVEFALALPLLLFFFAVSADFACLFWRKQVLVTCAYNGAAYASQADSADPEFAESTKAAALMNAGELADKIVIDSSVVQNPRGKNCVEVTAHYTFVPIMKLPFLPQSVELSHVVRMRQIVEATDYEP